MWVINEASIPRIICDPFHFFLFPFFVLFCFITILRDLIIDPVSLFVHFFSHEEHDGAERLHNIFILFHWFSFIHNYLNNAVFLFCFVLFILFLVLLFLRQRVRCWPSLTIGTEQISEWFWFVCIFLRAFVVCFLDICSHCNSN